MYKQENINAAKSLVITYRSITKEDLLGTDEAKWNINTKPFLMLRDITNFGIYGCSLCSSVNRSLLHKHCDGCIYYKVLRQKCDDYNYMCQARGNKKTYKAILKAKTIDELLIAIANRADHIEAIINHIESGKSKQKIYKEQ